jgi:hypothetical protein
VYFFQQNEKSGSIRIEIRIYLFKINSVGVTNDKDDKIDISFYGVDTKGELFARAESTLNLYRNRNQNQTKTEHFLVQT